MLFGTLELTSKRKYPLLLIVYSLMKLYSRIGNFKKAHEVYLEGCSARFLDYPEYLLEAWLTFEHQNGTLADLEFTIAKVKRQRRGLEARRRRVSVLSLMAKN